MTAALYRLAHASVRHRLVVLAAWLLVTIALVVVSHRLGDNTNDNLSLPGTGSQRATNTLAGAFPEQANGTSPIVLHARSGRLTEPRYAQAVNEAAAAVARAPDVASVVNPLTPEGAAALSKDQSTAYLSVTPSVAPGELSTSDAQRIVDAAAPAKAAGLEVETGGQLGQKLSKPATESSEAVGILAAMVILTLTFGAVAAMLLPIVNAVIALALTLSLIRILTHATTVPSVAPTLATMIGLGVGIDYALFVVTRHLRGLDDGLSVEEAIARSCATSGGAVLFAGGTVTIALVSLGVAGIPLVTTMGLMAAIAVVVAVLAALTLLPALLGITGGRVRSLSVRKPAAGGREHATRWARWASAVTGHPLAAGLAALAVLVPLSIPLLSLTLGQQDVAALPTSTTARRAYDLLAHSFGPGTNGPLLIAVTLGSPAKAPSTATHGAVPPSGAQAQSSQGAGQAQSSQGAGQAQSSQGAPVGQTDPRTGDPRLVQLQRDVAATKGVAATTPIVLDKQGTAAYFNAIAASGPAQNATAQLVERLRTSTIPEAERGTNVRAYVGGTTAGYVDLASRISAKLPLQIMVVIALSFALLVVAFRTLVIPAQAAVMNLLSIGAAYGVLTAIFQYGWLSGPVGLNGSVPIVSYVPLFMFAVLFGLSMDYEVFLVSQIEERHALGADTRSAVASGLVRSGRVITSAALIMVFVFGSFVLNGDPTVKQFGVGLAVAVILDATVVRCMLVPATMSMMGRANWWMPRWLDTLLPGLSIEGTEFIAALEHRAAP